MAEIGGMQALGTPTQELRVELWSNGSLPGAWASKPFSPILTFTFDNSAKKIVVDEIVHVVAGRVVDRAPYGPVEMRSKRRGRPKGRRDEIVLTLGG